MKSVLFQNLLSSEFMIQQLFIIFLCALTEQICFMSTLLGLLYLISIRLTSLHWTQKQFKVICIALLFPELGKISAFLLQTWDNEPMLLFFIGIMVLSIQMSALRVMLPHEKPTFIIIAFCCAFSVRQLIRITAKPLYDRSGLRSWAIEEILI
jgi:hypothetical protein